MADLASTDDLESRIGRTLTATESTRAAPYLADASSLIRGYTRQQFEAVDGDVVRLRPLGTSLRLPQRPVTAVNSVTAIGWAGIPNLLLPPGVWGWDGIDIVEIGPLSSDVWLSLPTLDLGSDLPDTYEVDYDHGAATIPPDVVAVCAGMVLRVLLAPSLTEGMSSERIGQYSYQMSQQVNGGSPGVSVRLSEQDKDALRQAGYGPRRSGTIEVRL